MERWPEKPTRWAAEIWSCPWCFARTEIGGEDFAILRPPYHPVDLRWERADGPVLPAAVGHAYGSFRRTLCDISDPDLMPSDRPWYFAADDACPACKDKAVLVDDRWPPDRRGEDDRVTIWAGA
jgi:hypothetical protein